MHPEILFSHCVDIFVYLLLSVFQNCLCLPMNLADTRLHRVGFLPAKRQKNTAGKNCEFFLDVFNCG